MKTLDDFAQGPQCIAMLAGLAFTSVLFAPPSDQVGQAIVWAGAFVFPALAFLIAQLMPDAEAERLGVFARYPAFAVAALFLTQVAVVYRWNPMALNTDTLISAVGFYLLFATLTVGDLILSPRAERR